MWNSPNFYRHFIWLVILAVVYYMALLRPIHQDDGWYASYALRYLADLGILDNPSYFSFSDINGGKDTHSSFLFSSLQSFFLTLFGFGVGPVRILNSLAITLILVLVHQIVSFYMPRFRWWFTAILAINPIFYYHFYNRPETIATSLMLLSIWLLLSKGSEKIYVFIAYFVWALILDTHPIAIFGVIGIGTWFWVRNLNKSLTIVFGGLSGLLFMLIINQLVNGNLGLFAGWAGQVPINFGDHYVPLLESDFLDFLRIGKERLDTIKSFLVLSGMFIILPFIIYKSNGINFLRHPLIINYFVFVLLSTLGTEASSNGFALYSIVLLVLFFAAIFEFLVQLQSFRFWYLLFVPLIGWSLNSMATTLVRNYNYKKSFDVQFQRFSDCIDENSKVLMRPTFVFATADKGLHSDYFYGILQVMLDNNMSFDQALIFRGYDFVVLDDRNLNEELFLDVRDGKLYDNPAYSKYRSVGISSADFKVLIQNGFLEQLCDFEEISHGKSILYKVNKQ
jgi:hypothetical protein